MADLVRESDNQVTEADNIDSLCVVCKEVNHYVREKLYPCNNQKCEKYEELVINVCNNCIRDLQRSKKMCFFCNKQQLQTNAFGQYRNNYLKKFKIGLLSTKYVTTKSSILSSEQLAKIDRQRLGQFISLPIISFNLVSLQDNIKDKTPDKMILKPDLYAQSLELLMNYTDEHNNQISCTNQYPKLAHTTECLQSLSRTCHHNMIRCGTNQILITGGYFQDLDFIYGINIGGKQVKFQERIHSIWSDYQKGNIDQDYLINAVTQVQQEYVQCQAYQNAHVFPPGYELPFYYPYLNTTFLINLNQSDLNDFSIVAKELLFQNRAFHQTVVTHDKIFVIGGISNGFVLDSIEVAQITRDVSSQIIDIQPFEQITSMNQPRANFSALYKPAVQCTEATCVYLKSQYSILESKDPSKKYCKRCFKEGSHTKCELKTCQSKLCPNQEFIYMAGGQTAYGQPQGQFTIERFSFKTQQCENIVIKENTPVLDQYTGMTLGHWDNDLFIFGGVPKSKEIFNKMSKSCFVLLEPGKQEGFQDMFGTNVISNTLAPCYLPQFTVSIPYLQQNLDEVTKYRVFVMYDKSGQDFCFYNYKISRDSKGQITFSDQIQSQVTDFALIKESWVQQGFQDGQSFVLLNSFVE